MPPSRTGAHDEYLHCRSSHPGSPLSFSLPNRQFMATGSGLMTALRGVEAQFLLQGSVDRHSGDDGVPTKSAILTQNCFLIVCLPCPSRSPPILPKSGEVLENILSPKRCLLEITFFASVVVTFRISYSALRSFNDASSTKFWYSSPPGPSPAFTVQGLDWFGPIRPFGSVPDAPPNWSPIQVTSSSLRTIGSIQTFPVASCFYVIQCVCTRTLLIQAFHNLRNRP